MEQIYDLSNFVWIIVRVLMNTCILFFEKLFNTSLNKVLKPKSLPKIAKVIASFLE